MLKGMNIKNKISVWNKENWKCHKKFKRYTKNKIVFIMYIILISKELTIITIR